MRLLKAMRSPKPMSCGEGHEVAATHEVAGTPRAMQSPQLMGLPKKRGVFETHQWPEALISPEPTAKESPEPTGSPGVEVPHWAGVAISRLWTAPTLMLACQNFSRARGSQILTDERLHVRRPTSTRNEPKFARNSPETCQTWHVSRKKRTSRHICPNSLEYVVGNPMARYGALLRPSAHESRETRRTEPARLRVVVDLWHPMFKDKHIIHLATATSA